MSEIHESIKPKLKSVLLKMGIVLLVVFVGVAVFATRDTWLSWLGFEKEVVTLDEVNVSEKIYFSLKPTEGEGVDSWGTYTKDIADKASELQLHELSWPTADAKAEASQVSFSPNGEWVTFVARGSTTVPDLETGFGTDFQIYKSKTKESLEDSFSEATQLTDTNESWKSLPRINDNGDVVYMSVKDEVYEGSTLFSPLPSDWEVRLLQDGGTSIIDGMYPQWFKDTGLIYLSDNGIVYHDIDSDLKTIIVSHSALEVHLADIMFDVSNDGSLMVMSTPFDQDGFVSIFDLYLGDINVTLNLRQTVSGLMGIWPVISPDNKYFGLYDLNFDPRYTFYSTVVDPEETGQLTESVLPDVYLSDFNDDNINSLRITDWH